jgi:hypothetical protein
MVKDKRQILLLSSIVFLIIHGVIQNVEDNAKIFLKTTGHLSFTNYLQQADIFANGRFQ